MPRKSEKAKKPRRVVLGQGYMSTDGLNVSLTRSCPCGKSDYWLVELESGPLKGKRVCLVAEVL